MKHIFLEIEELPETGGIKALHRYLKSIFDFPDCYGENLDALYDCLRDISEATAVTVPWGFEELFDGYGARIIKVFEDAAAYNGNLQLNFREK